MPAATVTGTVTAVETSLIETMSGQAQLILITLHTGDVVRAQAIADPTGTDTDVQVGQTITASGNRRPSDGQVATRGKRDEDGILHYWTIEG